MNVEQILTGITEMKLIISAALVALAARLEAQVAVSGPKIEFDTKQHNFGDIREDMKYATHRFTFKNTGNKDLFINTVQSSCGCTTPDWTRDTVHPGESGFVDAKYETIGRIGSFQKTITVYSNAVNYPFVHLDILGNVLRDVVNNEPAQVDYGHIQFSRPTVDFKVLYDNKTDTQEVRITNNTTFSATFNPIENLPAYCKVTGMPASLEPNESAKITITLDGRQMKGYGFGAFEIPISSDNPIEPYLGLYVAYNRKQYFPKMSAKELARAPKLVIDKKIHDFGTGESGDIFNAEFKFTNEGKTDLKLLELYPDCACVQVDLTKNVLKPGESTTVKMRYDSGIKHGKSTQSIWIVSNDPTEPERHIYLKVQLPEAKKPKCPTCPD